MMSELFGDFLRKIAIDLRYAAADAKDDAERGSLNALASALEMMAGYRRAHGTIGLV